VSESAEKNIGSEVESEESVSSEGSMEESEVSPEENLEVSESASNADGEEGVEAQEEDKVLSPQSLVPALNALLFSSAKPLSVNKLCKCLAVPREVVAKALDEVFQMFSGELHGFSLAEINGRYQFRTSPEHSEELRRLHPPKMRRISQAAAETLSVIAYKQPVHKGEIESIRGVDALPTIKTLLDAKLIRIVGKEDVPGTPVLYGTSDKFLERFGLNDLSELPSIADLEEIELEPGEIEEVSAGALLSKDSGLAEVLEAES